MQSHVDEVLALLRQAPGPPAAPEVSPLSRVRLAECESNLDPFVASPRAVPYPGCPQSASPPTGGSSSGTLTQRLLRQNAELTGFVSRLTEEKNDLRNQALRLEEEIRRYRRAGPATGDCLGKGTSKPDSSGTLLSQEREAWAREKSRLERALHQAQAQVARLRGEIRSDTLRHISGPEADNAALKVPPASRTIPSSFRQSWQSLLFSSSSFLVAEDLREVLEVGKLPQSARLPEEIPAVTAGRIPGVRGGNAVAADPDGRPAGAVQPGLHRPAPPGAHALPIRCPGLYRPLQAGNWRQRRRVTWTYSTWEKQNLAFSV